MKIIMLSLLAGIAILTPVIAQTTQPASVSANLLNNGDFTKTDDKGAPLHWKLYAKGQNVSVDAAEKPEGVSGSLKIVVQTESKGQGAISQKLKNIPQDTKLVLTGRMKGTVGRLGKLQIKLKKEGKEIDRISSSWNELEWAETEVEFSTGEADEITVECRFSQADEAVGETIYFADLNLREQT